MQNGDAYVASWSTRQRAQQHAIKHRHALCNDAVYMIHYSAGFRKLWHLKAFFFFLPHLSDYNMDQKKIQVAARKAKSHSEMLWLGYTTCIRRSIHN